MNGEFCFFHSRDPLRSPIQSTLDTRTINTIVAAIEAAWNQLKTFRYLKCEPFSLSDYGDEDTLTAKLQEILNDQLQNNGGGAFCKERFQTVVRDGKQHDSSSESQDQMPDLTFRLVHSAPGEDRDEAALFVEAKLVDRVRGCRLYVVNGLYRFVTGKYAPRVTFGMMLAYTRRDYHEAHTHLTDYFKGASATEALACKAKLTRSEAHPGCFESDHVRHSPCPPDFRALHLWLIRQDGHCTTT